jgi:hypothetical protein
MTYSVPRTSAIALGVAAFVSLSTLSAADPQRPRDGSKPRANDCGSFA